MIQILQSLINKGNEGEPMNRYDQTTGRWAESCTALFPLNDPCSKRTSLHLYFRTSQGRQSVENLIASGYHKKFGARIADFMPIFLSLQTLDRIAAVVGIRSAAESALFLEAYLDGPLLQTLTRCGFPDVSRTEVVEIGNLVSTRSGSSFLLFLVLTKMLFISDYKIAVFTATSEVANLLTKLQLPISPICKAEHSRLTPSLTNKPQADWGNYYAANPWVFAIDGRLAINSLTSRSMLAQWVATYDTEITNMRCYL